MAALTILLALTLLAVLVGLVFVVQLVDRVDKRDRDRGLEARLRRTFIVHTHDGQSIRGVLVEEHIDILVLTQAEWLHGARPQGLGSEVVIPRENFAWGQDVSSDGQIERRGYGKVSSIGA